MTHAEPAAPVVGLAEQVERIRRRLLAEAQANADEAVRSATLPQVPDRTATTAG